MDPTHIQILLRPFLQTTQRTKGTYIGSVENSSYSQSSSPSRQENFKRRGFGAGANGRAHGERAWERKGNARCEHACTWPDCSVIEKGSAFEPKMHSFGSLRISLKSVVVADHHKSIHYPHSSSLNCRHRATCNVS